MDDTISRAAAIDAFLTELTKRERKNFLHTWSTVEVKYFVADMLEKLPSAQPGCEDVVYRKAVQRLLAYFVPDEKYAEAVDGLRRLPSAQPEIIRCKDCRYNNDCEIQYSAQSADEFFCGCAERKDNE